MGQKVTEPLQPEARENLFHSETIVPLSKGKVSETPMSPLVQDDEVIEILEFESIANPSVVHPKTINTIDLSKKRETLEKTEEKLKQIEKKYPKQNTTINFMNWNST